MKYRVIDADAHTIEPPGMWERYLPAKFQDKAPKLVKDHKGGDAWEFQRGVTPMPIGMVTTAGQRYEEFDWFGHGYDDIRKGCYLGQDRLEDMDFDGIDAAVLYPSQRTMMYFMANEDDEFHKAGVDAYNKWVLNEFAGADQKRLLPMFQMPNLGIETSLSELHRAKKEGFRGVILTRFPSGNPTLNAADEPFWAQAEEIGMPIHIHINIGGAARAQGTAQAAALQAATAGAMTTSSLLGGTLGAFGTIMADSIHQGIFDRYPALRMVGVEVQAGWIPAVLEFWDDRYWRNRTVAECTLKMLPSEYFYRNWTVTFITDYYGVKNRHDIGVKNMMWSTDYPHHGADWPYSRKVADQMFYGVPKEEKELMTCGNAMELYGLRND